MKHLKILSINIKPEIDYKTLDINQFIAGSQVYDFANGVCLVQTSEDNYTPHADIIELTESEYNEQRDIINSMSPQAQEKDKIAQLEEKDKIAQLEEKVDLQEQALAELTMFISTLSV